jgi:AcrR family transcriptional regulator
MVRVAVKPPDRRSQRTQDALLDALVGLLMERGYERITIQQLLDRSSVGRATFYAHFESKDALLAASIARLHAHLQKAWCTAPPQRLGFTLPFFAHLASHRRIYHLAVVREREATVQRYIRRMLSDLVQQDLKQRPTAHINDATLSLITQYIVGALWSTIVWWMDAGTHLTPVEINTEFQRLVFPGLDATFGARWSRTD